MNILKGVMNIGNSFMQLARNARRNSNNGNGFSNWFWTLGESFSASRQSQHDLTEYAYINNDLGYSVATKIARLVGRVPRVLKTKSTQNGREKKIVDRGELYNLLMIAPNDDQNPDEYLEELALNLMLSGKANTYAPIESIGFPSKQLIPIPSEAVKPVKNNYSDLFEKVKKYELYAGSNIKSVLPEEMIIAKFIDPSLEGKQNHYGLSPFQALWTTVKANNNRNVAESVILENKGASGLISPDSVGGNTYSFTEYDKHQLDSGLKERIGGAFNFGKIINLSKPAKYIPIGMSPSDLKLLETDLIHLRKICNALGIQSQIFNDPQNKSYNNMKEAEKALYIDVVIPIAEKLMGAHERTIIKKYEEIDGKEYYWEVDKDKIEALLPDPIEVRKQTIEAFKAGLITEDEAREALGKDPLTDEQRQEIRELIELRRPRNNQNNTNQNGQGNNQNNQKA